MQRVVPQLVRRAISYELGMWRSLYRWVLRRPRALGPDAEAFGYSRTATPVFGVFIGLSAFEVVVVHLLLPWESARRIALALGVYGLFWMVGLLASLRVHPHVVDSAGLRARYGATVEVTIPWHAVAAVRTRRRPLPGRTIQLDRTTSDFVLSIGMMHQTSVDVALRQPIPVRLPKGTTEPVTELRFHVDDPDAFTARAREHLAANQPPSRTAELPTSNG